MRRKNILSNNETIYKIVIIIKNDNVWIIQSIKSCMSHFVAWNHVVHCELTSYIIYYVKLHLNNMRTTYFVHM